MFHLRCEDALGATGSGGGIVFVLEATSADEWQDVVSGCFVPLSCQSFAPTFRGRMEHTVLDPSLSVSRLSTDGTTVERSAHLAARAETDDLHFSLQQASRGRVSQAGVTVPVRPGSVTTYATNAPYRQDYSQPDQRQLIIQVSRRSLRLPGRMIDEACTRLLVPESAAARTLFGYVGRLPVDDANTPASAAETSLDLAATMIQESFSSGPVMPRTSRGMLEIIRDHVERNFTSPALTIEALAERHFMSRRRLYQLFNDVGDSPADLIRSRRLRHAAELLLRDAEAPPSVGEVSEQSGFADATTFARAFRRQYGLNPSDYRSAA